MWSYIDFINRINERDNNVFTIINFVDNENISFEVFCQLNEMGDYNVLSSIYFSRI